MRTAVHHALLALVALAMFPAADYVQMPPRNASPVLIDVTPRKATVVVDGEEAGKARNFDSRAYPLWLSRGTHVIELRHKGYQTLRLRLGVRPGRAYRVHYDLREGSGLDPRSRKGNEAAEPDDRDNTI